MLTKISLVVLLVVVVAVMSEELSLEEQWTQFKVSEKLLTYPDILFI